LRLTAATSTKPSYESRRSSSQPQGQGTNGSNSKSARSKPVNLSSAGFDNLSRTSVIKLQSGICPELVVTEHNVWQVVEKLLAATQSMSMLLSSLNDDLRRTGALSSAAVSDGVRKRREVATKLWRAFLAYRKSFNDIESFTQNAPKIDSTTSSSQRPATSKFQSPKVSPAQPFCQYVPPIVTRPSEVIELSDSDDESSCSQAAEQPPEKRRCLTPPSLIVTATNVENGSRKGTGLDMTVSDESNSSYAKDGNDSQEDNKGKDLTVAAGADNGI